MNRFVGGIVFAVVVAVGALWLHQSGHIPSFEEIRASRDAFHAYAMSMPIRAVLAFSITYIGVVALSIPLATPLSLLAGFIFGSVLGTVLVVLSATLGAVVIFILARYFFRDFFEARASKIAAAASAEAHLNGFRDVLIARLVPAVPFSLINLVAGLTRVRLRDYALATLIGIVPFSFVYVHAGVALGEITSLREVASSESWMFVSRIALVIVVLYIMRRVYAARSRRATGENT